MSFLVRTHRPLLRRGTSQGLTGAAKFTKSERKKMVNMRSPNWGAPTSSDEAHKRAGGRRRYNSHRQFVAFVRRQMVVALAWEFGLARRGSRSRIARAIGVHRSTVSKDIKAILAEMNEARDCPACGQPVKDIVLQRAFDGPGHRNSTGNPVSAGAPVEQVTELIVAGRGDREGGIR